jgi:hypothetical protein
VESVLTQSRHFLKSNIKHYFLPFFLIGRHEPFSPCLVPGTRS